MQAQYTATTTGEGEQEHNGVFHSPTTIHSLRLKDPPPTVTTAATTGRTSKKRKVADPSPLADHPLAHPMIHPHLHHMSQFPFGPVDYSPGGLPPNIPNMPVPGAVNVPSPSGLQQADQSPNSPSDGDTPKAGRALAQSKRAEQNRKAQRAFRERRDAHVKALESRSQLLDSALASADEANRRWEECRALVDQLRIENAALRQALNQAQLLANANGHMPQPPPQVNLPPHLTTNPPAIQPSRLTASSTENKEKEKDEKRT
ncbi:hypothetical protein BJ322DRAFT_1064711 [Thelephora terrestris]|uniref:BZIP domain-containing protein n=1 Tax=Thelephora terrestris TaxID=56493 RepID=A0A9P6HEY0_9AGAM|nr:hypothetical protein BJ322DRAFT_1064711 [Thelephora terrestris]